MYRNIFSKYILTFMVIVVTNFILFILIASFLINGYSVEMKKELMENSSQSIYSSLNGVMTLSKMPLEDIIKVDNGYIVDVLNENAEANTAVIFITDNQGRVLVASNNAKGIIPSKVDEALVEGYLSEDYSYSTLGGIFKKEHINVIHPINVFPPGRADYDSETSLGAIFICSENNNPIIKRLGSSVFITLLWIFGFSFVAVYFVSERISRPLKEMSRAAKNFAKGNFSVRVPVRGNDEVSELATAFNNMAGSLEKLEENRSQFISNVSHDLRTPMTTISGFIDGILSGTIPKDKTDYYLEIVASEVKRLSRLVNSLLDITRIQSGERKFTMTSFDACELARQVLISCESRIDKKKLDIVFECDDDNMNVIADRDAIHQIMYNLVDNAVKFSNEGGTITLTVRENDDKLYVTVRNTGMGISKEELPHVFEQFYKSDRSRGLDKTGVGLGLYISKTIIDQHGEEMWVTSEEGVFCEFTFTLQKDKKTK
ncbi:MAG: HAMP domain-containing histidine kinase [Ruminococcaceae bacterium]|nr:HAMP domain-containing histidine kinase [Oscillospiraceae bacterium]